MHAPDGGVETLTGPRYSGVTGDGSNVQVVAGKAWPKADGSGFEASNVIAKFDMSGGEQAEVRANSGTVTPADNLLALRGEVVVTTASGWTLRSETLDGLLDWTRIESQTAVRTEGPIGTLDAAQMLITRDTGSDDNFRMEFEGGVHLVYRP